MAKKSVIKVLVGLALVGMLCVGVLGVSVIFGAKVSGGAPMLEGYGLIAAAGGFLLSIPLGIGYKLADEIV